MIGLCMEFSKGVNVGRSELGPSCCATAGVAGNEGVVAERDSMVEAIAAEEPKLGGQAQQLRKRRLVAQHACAVVHVFLLRDRAPFQQGAPHGAIKRFSVLMRTCITGCLTCTPSIRRISGGCTCKLAP